MEKLFLNQLDFQNKEYLKFFEDNEQKIKELHRD